MKPSYKTTLLGHEKVGRAKFGLKSFIVIQRCCVSLFRNPPTDHGE